MDEVVEFVRGYLKVEHAARVAALTEPDEKTARAAVARADAAYARGARAGIDRRDEIGDDERDEARRAVERPLFVVRAYAGGRIFAAIVGEPWRRPYGTAFDSVLFIERRRERLAIVARYSACPDCDATGSVGGKKCRDCNGAGWSVRTTGRAIEFGTLGAPVATRRFGAPDVERFTAAYNA